MIKFIASLLTTVASFLGIFGISDAVAAPVVVETPVNTIQPVSLNETGSLWQLDNKDAQDFFAHLGCSCAVCAGVVDTATEL